MLRRDYEKNGTESHYKRKFKWVSFCVYCGEPAGTLDHVFPISLASKLNLNRAGVRRELFQGLSKVPCCLECNVVACDKPFVSILEKRRHIQKTLKKRYRKLLKTPDWDKEELSQVGYALRMDIKGALEKRNRVERRVMWPVLRQARKRKPLERL